MVKYIVILFFLVIYGQNVFPIDILYDDIRDEHDPYHYWQCIMDTLATYGISVHYTSVEGWGNIMNMDVVWLQSPIPGDYYSPTEKAILQSYCRYGGKIFMAPIRNECIDTTSYVIDDLLSDYGWETSIKLIYGTYESRGVFCSLFVELPPITNGVHGIVLYAPQLLSCGENCYPLVFADNSPNEIVGAISFPFLEEGNCSSFVFVLAGNHTFEDGSTSLPGFGDTWIFARNIFLTLTGVPGYEFDPCAFAETTFTIEPEEYTCSRAPNPFTPNGDGKNDFSQFTFDGIGEKEATIRIFDMHSHQVRTIKVPAGAAAKSAARWDGRDNSGNSLTEGLYLYTIECEGEIVCDGSVVIAR